MAGLLGSTLTIPQTCMAGQQPHFGGGIWGHSGVASDGTNMFVITGNTFNTGGNWMGGEAIIRLGPDQLVQVSQLIFQGPLSTGSPSTTRTPTLAASVRCSSTCRERTPRSFVLALGKDGNAYLSIAIILAVLRRQ